MAFDTAAQLTLFSLIMMRMSGMILFNPLLGRRNIPMTVKSGIILALTVTIYLASVESAFEITNTLQFGFFLMKEFAVGYVIGYAMELFFFAITFGGYVIDFQLGLTMATVYDPQSNSQIAVTGSVLQTWFVLLFFAVDGHLALMKILITSGEVVPYGGIVITQGLADRMIEIFLQCAELGIRLSLPILAAEFLVQVGIGIMNKVVPQISIFVINIQLKIIVGLGLLAILFSPIGSHLNRILSEMMKTVQGILTFV
ncbi:MAG: flagellar biosynthetic protein FliR [Dorea sp.]|nr:flagellar biosynthetic protein FliR [Dorea sp.]